MPAFSEKPFFIRHGTHRLSAMLHAGSSRRLVVMAHGFTGQKIEQGRIFVTAARALAAAGIGALRFDFMGSGESTGLFPDMTPNTEIADLHAVLDWARRAGYRRVGVLGLSLGGAVSICTVAARPAGEIAALCTWSSVPGFGFWRPKPDPVIVDRKLAQHVGRAFFTDRPKVDVPAAYVSLTMPKLQIQGDTDLPGFREEFARFFTAAAAPKRHVVIPGADHVVTQTAHRQRVIRTTVAWFDRYL